MRKLSQDCLQATAHCYDSSRHLLCHPLHAVSSFMMHGCLHGEAPPYFVQC